MYCEYESNEQFQMTAKIWHQLMFFMYVWYSIFTLKKSSSKTRIHRKKITSFLPNSGLFCVSRECRSDRNIIPSDGNLATTSKAMKIFLCNSSRLEFYCI